MPPHKDSVYIPDPASEARGKAALQAYQDAIAGRVTASGIPVSVANSALDQWNAQLSVQADLPVPGSSDNA
jgi:hypothetical protein